MHLLYVVLAALVGALLTLVVTHSRAAAVLVRAERAEAELAAERRSAPEKIALVERAEARLGDTFAALSDRALEQAVARHSSAARADLDARRDSVAALVAPVRESLGQVASGLQALEVSRAATHAGLVTQLRSLGEVQERLRTETAGLVTALRAPAVRGRWGEIQLRRVVELAGMLEHADFVSQPTVDGEDGRLRPDLVVRLPGGASVVVDAKVPLAGYLQAIDAVDDAAERVQLAAHARQLRAHVDALAAKSYWQHFTPSPEFVVLFVPGEPFLSAALQADPELLDYGVARSVLLATPTTLIGLLKAVAYGWRQEGLADSARVVCDLGRTLHERLAGLVGKVDKVGRALDTAVGAYNDAVGSLESRVLVSARRLADLRVTDAGLPPPRQVDKAARHVVAGELTPP